MIVHYKAAIAALFVLVSPIAVGDSQAQTSTTTSAPMMWGTTPGGVSVLGALDSAIAHSQNGAIAGQVNAARAGVLFGSNTTIQSIGSQTIMQNTITGSNNNATINGSPTSTNSGAVTNNGTVHN